MGATATVHLYSGTYEVQATTLRQLRQEFNRDALFLVSPVFTDDPDYEIIEGESYTALDKAIEDMMKDISQIKLQIEEVSVKEKEQKKDALCRQQASRYRRIRKRFRSWWIMEPGSWAVPADIFNFFFGCKKSKTRSSNKKIFKFTNPIERVQYLLTFTNSEEEKCPKALSKSRHLDMRHWGPPCRVHEFSTNLVDHFISCVFRSLHD
eukprot:TRINITY_DN2066_c0_g1_i1.p1 TRINITY_DN2066_c0_g1~~TRINITY_DN2066_c0_g1_i1.p1  ORF type:complete len:215 (-),score=32.07 TRINITY_DN2066_c0_g1_i1:158-781(-)